MKTCATYLNIKDFYKALQNRTELFTEPEKKVIDRFEHVATSKNLTGQKRASYLYDQLARVARYSTFEEAYDALMSKYYVYYTNSMLRAVAKRLITRNKVTNMWVSGVTHIEFDRLVHATVADFTNGLYGGDHAP